MQDKKLKSPLIRLNHLANKRARRRLVGSIFLLVIALLVLLHVSSKIKPVQIKPESIEIKTNKNASTPIKSGNNPIIVESKALALNETTPHPESSTNASSAKIDHLHSSLPKIAKAQTVKKDTSDIVNNVNPAKEISSTPKNEKQTSVKKSVASSPTGSKSKLTHMHINPIVATEQATVNNANPQDILDAIDNKKSKPQYFVQLLASTDKAHVLMIKTQLSASGISSKVESIKRGNKTLYRLRIGPFHDKAKAMAKLTQVQDKLANN